jgi:hypothetical protein
VNTLFKDQKSLVLILFKSDLKSFFKNSKQKSEQKGKRNQRKKLKERGQEPTWAAPKKPAGPANQNQPDPAHPSSLSPPCGTHLSSLPRNPLTLSVTGNARRRSLLLFNP